jgi:RHH-type proline utilization regulon transcriptional repressor/proline dehydrogenase/delta 1-pyrroline-5-carboxylate dehydrogenase
MRYSCEYRICYFNLLAYDLHLEIFIYLSKKKLHMEKVYKEAVIEHVKSLLEESEREITVAERKEQRKYALLIKNANDKNLLSRMLDESSQIRDTKKLALRIRQLFISYGIPGFFNRFDTFLIVAFTKFGYLFDRIAVPIFKKKLRQDTAKVIIDEKKSVFHRHLASRKRDKIGQNVNLLGEVVLGDREADNRYQHYLEALENPRINYISIKISGIYAQISALNYEQNKKDLCERLTAIYRQAITHPFEDENGEKKSKFVNLDMEEYKDSHLTLDVFKEVLSLPEFKNYTAGIVLQAYLPDAWNFQTELLSFAHKRVAGGGAPLKMRLVKGANLAMETVLSSLKGWENPIFDNKIDVDANYLRILDRACLPENAAVVSIGVASHNLFTISYAHLLAATYKVENYVSFEMLEGMANYLPRVLKSINKQIILYTPVVSDANFLNAVSYLVRRLDENTGKDNFLSYAFDLKVGSDTWEFLRNQFEEAYKRKDKVSLMPRRVQNRNIAQEFELHSSFKNESDTDFDLPVNRKWADNIRIKWKKNSAVTPYLIPVQIGNDQFTDGRRLSYVDHNQNDEVTVCEVVLSDQPQVARMLEIAENDPAGWSALSPEQIKEILHRTATQIANKRGDLIGCMSAITGKTFNEGDVEVSEAIDFCRYYPLSIEKIRAQNTVTLHPKGIVLVVPPWNFPTAIPVGGVAAALAGGNRVILKPATVAYPIAWEFAQCFWNAGVPKEALQLVCGDGRAPINYLTSHRSIKQIIFTGGTDTALKLMASNPSCPMSAETGGKNAMILTSACDRDHAIQNIMTSAFSNAGQKCSACSLLILEKGIYDDSEFKEKLKDAALSLHAGSAWNPGNFVGPMVSNYNDKLEKAFELEPGESWLVEPEFIDPKKYVLRPTIKWGVKPGNYTFVTELFAPLLAVVCVDSLEEAIQVANSSEYGLTAGLQSLDEIEQARWKETIEAGNLYINRGITGAIVSRQPFGGTKRSAFGAGIKAGGPNYVVSFMDAQESRLLDAEEKLTEATLSYQDAWNNEFSVERDIHQIYGESNVFRYRPVNKMAMRVLEGDHLIDLLMILKAAEVTSVQLDISCPHDSPFLTMLKEKSPESRFFVEDIPAFADRMENYERVRTTSSHLPEELYRKSAETGVYLANRPPLTEGLLELIHYVREQSVSYEYHRYGNIVDNAQ